MKKNDELAKIAMQWKIANINIVNDIVKKARLIENFLMAEKQKEENNDRVIVKIPNPLVEMEEKKNLNKIFSQLNDIEMALQNLQEKFATIYELINQCNEEGN